MPSPHAHPHRWLILGVTLAFVAAGVALYLSPLHRGYLYGVIAAYLIFRALLPLRVRRKTAR